MKMLSEYEKSILGPEPKVIALCEENNRLRAENEKLRAALSRAAKELEFVKVNSQYRFAAEAARDAAATLEGLDDE